MRHPIRFAAIASLLATCALAWAEPRVSMTSTVPRDQVYLTIYNPAVSLVQERRAVSLAAGLNQFRVSWAGVNVQARSVRLMPLEGAPVEVRDAVFPSGDPNTVLWHLEAARAGAYPLSLSYYVGGFSWNAEYVLTVDEQEKTLWLKAWANITNASGESYSDAHLRLVMGDIRLLSPGRPEVPTPLAAQAAERARPAADAEAPFAREGFAEYTFYTLERPETLDDGDTKRIALAASKPIPVRKVYTFDPQRFGANVAMQYWVENKAEHNLGPMPPGLLRAYRQEADGRLSLVGEDMLAYVPLGETAKIYLGNAHNIIVETVQTDYRRSDEQWSADKSRIIKHVEEAAFKVTVKNRKAYDIELILRQYIPTDAQLVEAQPQPQQPRLGALEWNLKLAAGETRELTYRYRRTVYNT